MSFFSLTEATAFACAVMGSIRGVAKTRTWCDRYTRGRNRVERYQVFAPLAEVVYADLRGRCAKQNTSIGELSAQLLALATDHLEFGGQFDLEMLCVPVVLARVDAVRVPHVCTGTRIRTEVWVPTSVYADILEHAAINNCNAGEVAADLLAVAAGHPDAVRHLQPRKALDLAGEA